MNNYRKAILDSSALIALINRELGHEIVETVIDNSIMSAVNVAEVARFLVDKSDYKMSDISSIINHLVNEVYSFDVELAYIGAEVYRSTKKFGLSLGDRACLSLAISSGNPVYTSDKIWQKLGLDNVEIILIG